ncbi:hypothetical protein C1Y40_02830 [Mycobacterium talmoniae]|uniref:Uncharacterized protein n=1 Tax=Mycobacterium talmoniae TaxID=1858794 RepID=A0A2S8BK40_9MYCO|nr:hypothetical protein C1Y40_02830 [Mycobacterium talmoniae]
MNTTLWSDTAMPCCASAATMPRAVTIDTPIMISGSNMVIGLR